MFQEERAAAVEEETVAIFKSATEFEQIASALDPKDQTYDQMLDAIALEAIVIDDASCLNCGGKLSRDQRSFVWPLPGDEGYVVMDLQCIVSLAEAGKRYITETDGGS